VPGLRICVKKRSPSPPRGPAVTSQPKSTATGSDTARRVKVEPTDDESHEVLVGSKHKAQAQGDPSIQVRSEAGRVMGLSALPPPPHPGVPDERVADVPESRRRDHALPESSTPTHPVGASSPQNLQTQISPTSCENIVDAMHARPSLQSVSFSLPLHYSRPEGLDIMLLKLKFIHTHALVTPQEFSEAKMIILDLLGWGVPSEYLLRCGLAPKSLYYAFTELNLRYIRPLPFIKSVFLVP
jgi:hypothetical protein